MKNCTQDTIEEVAMVIVDTVQDNIAAASGTRGVARNLYMLYCAVWKVLRKIIHFYSYKPCTSHRSS